MKFTSDREKLTNHLIKTLVNANLFDVTRHTYTKLSIPSCPTGNTMVTGKESYVDIIRRFDVGLKRYNEVTGKHLLEDTPDDDVVFMFESSTPLQCRVISACLKAASQTEIAF